MNFVEFADKYGMLIATVMLFLVTALYTYITLRLAKVSEKEHRLRTEPQLSFQPIIVVADRWNSVSIKQEIVNIGLSYVKVESCLLVWWAGMETEHINRIKSDLVLPHYLAPGDRKTVGFEISTNQTKKYEQSAFESFDQLMNGHIDYKFSGLEGTTKEMVETLP